MREKITNRKNASEIAYINSIIIVSILTEIAGCELTSSKNKLKLVCKVFKRE